MMICRYINTHHCTPLLHLSHGWHKHSRYHGDGCGTELKQSAFSEKHKKKTLQNTKM